MSPSTLPLSGRTALITGGGRGIGAATSRALASRGADLLITYRSDHDTALALATSCRADHGVKADTVAFDLAAPDGAGELLAGVRATGAEIDILVANAAAPYPKVPLAELASSALTEKVGHDLGTLHRLITAVVSGMVERGFGVPVAGGLNHPVSLRRLLSSARS